MERDELIKTLNSIECQIDNLKKIGLNEDTEDIKELEKMRRFIENKLKKLDEED